MSLNQLAAEVMLDIMCRHNMVIIGDETASVPAWQEIQLPECFDHCIPLVICNVSLYLQDNLLDNIFPIC